MVVCRSLGDCRATALVTTLSRHLGVSILCFAKCNLLALRHRDISLALAHVVAVIHRLLLLFALDHAIHLNDQLVRKESLDCIAVNLDHMIFCKVELGLLLVLDHLCLFRLLVEPDVGAFCLVSELLVV